MRSSDRKIRAAGQHSDNPLPSRSQMPCVQNRGPLLLVSLTNPVPMPNVAGTIGRAINGPLLIGPRSAERTNESRGSRPSATCALCFLILFQSRTLTFEITSVKNTYAGRSRRS